MCFESVSRMKFFSRFLQPQLFVKPSEAVNLGPRLTSRLLLSHPVRTELLPIQSVQKKIKNIPNAHCHFHLVCEARPVISFDGGVVIFCT